MSLDAPAVIKDRRIIPREPDKAQTGDLLFTILRRQETVSVQQERIFHQLDKQNLWLRATFALNCLLGLGAVIIFWVRG